MGTGTQDTGGSVQPYQFAPEFYGAIGDNITDDTAALRNAALAGWNYALNHQGYAELILAPTTYYAPGATVQSATYKGNAQIPTPLVGTTARKPTLVIRGTRDQTSLYHWQQTSRQNTGSVIRSTIAGTNDGTWGEASCIGSPTPAQGYGGGTSVFNNALVVVDGVTVMVPVDSHVCGFDFRGMGEANVINGSCLVDTSGLIGSITSATQAWQFGLAMPAVNNNDNCNIGWFSAEGLNYGVIASEHTYIQSLRTIYCVAGIAASAGGGSSMPHGMLVDYWSCEACQIGLQLAVATANPTKLHIAMMDWEAGAIGGTFHCINDPSNNGVGYVGLMNGPTWDVNGGSFLRVIYLDKATGHITAPSVPATTLAYQNTTGRDAMVVISGGTVTAIAVDGTATGITSGTVMVPSGKTITLTYSVAPTWIWTLL